MKIKKRPLVSEKRNFSCRFDRPRPPFCHDKIVKIGKKAQNARKTTNFTKMTF